MSSQTKKVVRNMIHLNTIENTDNIDFNNLFYVYADGRKVVLLTENGRSFIKTSCLDEAVFLAAECRETWVKHIKSSTVEIMKREAKSNEKDFLLDGENVVLERKAALLTIDVVDAYENANEKRTKPCYNDLKSITDPSLHENYPEIDSDSKGSLVLTNRRILFIENDSMLQLPLSLARKITAGIHNVCIYCSDGRKIVFGNIPGISVALYICSVLIYTENLS